MKTLSKKAQQSLYTKAGELRITIASSIRRARIINGKIYTTRWVRSGKNMNIIDDTHGIITALKAGGYKYTFGNDAPRGGKEGDFVKCSNTAIKFLESLVQ